MTKPSHDFDNGVLCYDQNPIIWANGEDCLHDDMATPHAYVARNSESLRCRRCDGPESDHTVKEN